MHWMPGRLRSTIVASNSSRVLNGANTGSKSRSVTISVWLFGRLFALKFIGFGQASPGLMPRPVLSALPCVCIWLIRPSLSVQLRKFFVLRPGSANNREEEYSAEKSCHAHVERADAQERPAELSSKQLPNPKPCPAKGQINNRRPILPPRHKWNRCCTMCKARYQEEKLEASSISNPLSNQVMRDTSRAIALFYYPTPQATIFLVKNCSLTGSDISQRGIENHFNSPAFKWSYRGPGFFGFISFLIGRGLAPVVDDRRSN